MAYTRKKSNINIWYRDIDNTTGVLNNDNKIDLGFGIRNYLIKNKVKNVIRQISNNKYIVGVWYYKNNQLVDIQIGITGTYNSMDGEEFGENTLKREVTEETGLIINSIEQPIGEFQIDLNRQLSKHWKIYEINEKLVEPSNTLFSENKIYEKNDDNNKKIAAIIHGNYDNLKNKIKDSNLPIENLKKDNIKRVVLIRVGYIKDRLIHFNSE